MPPLYPELNLDFEDVVDGRAREWEVAAGVARPPRPGFEIGIDDQIAHHGRRSLRIASTGGGEMASRAVTPDVGPLRGNRVRVRGWIRTADVSEPGWAGLWIRADDGGPLDNMEDRGVRGTGDWIAVEARIDVPVDASAVVLGIMLVGDGTAWFDDLQIEVTDVPAVRPIVCRGSVVDADSTPVAGAIVALVLPGSSIASRTTTAADGRFEMSSKSGTYGLSAHHPSGVGVFTPAQNYEQTDPGEVVLQLGRDGGVTVRGRVRAAGPLPLDLHLEIFPVSQNDTDIFAVPVASDGTFAALLPPGDRYGVQARGEQARGSGMFTREGSAVDIDLELYVPMPIPDEVVAWIRAAAVPLARPEAGAGMDDLRPAAPAIGTARIVALGEATHGTREFFQLKHRFVEWLVAEQGFTVFAIEANQPECRAINDYVLRGEGDARAALNGIYFWTWNTEEVLEMIEWMRRWNADPQHAQKVEFLGFDMQTATVAYANVVAFVRRSAPGRAEALLDPIAMFAEAGIRNTWKPEGAKESAAVAGLDSVARAFDVHDDEWSAAAGRQEFLDARHDVRVLQQAAGLYGAQGRSFDARDAAMAENVAWILEHEPAGTRMVVWAHNGHIARQGRTVRSMGDHLAERFGRDYVNFGFVFSQGSFQAMDNTTGRITDLCEFTVGPPPADDLSVAFSRTGHPLLVLDLRKAPAGPVATWFAAKHPMRQIGAVYTSEERMSHLVELPPLYDGIVFVDKTTRARPVVGKN